MNTETKTHLGMNRAKVYCGRLMGSGPKKIERPDLALDQVTCKSCLRVYRWYWNNTIIPPPKTP